MGIHDKIASAIRKASIVVLIMSCCLKIMFYNRVKYLLFVTWRVLSPLKKYGMDHWCELAYNLLITVAGGIIVYCIMH